MYVCYKLFIYTEVDTKYPINKDKFSHSPKKQKFPFVYTKTNKLNVLLLLYYLNI